MKLTSAAKEKDGGEKAPSGEEKGTQSGAFLIII